MYDKKMLMYLMLSTCIVGFNLYVIFNYNKEFSMILILLYMISCALIVQIIINLIIFNRNLK